MPAGSCAASRRAGRSTTRARASCRPTGRAATPRSSRCSSRTGRRSSMGAQSGFAVGEHDWHSQDYVDWWLQRDREREPERRERLARMLTYAPFEREAEIAVVDIGGGYGIVSEMVLEAFPRARVTLQDYSQPMLEEAKRRLAPYPGRAGFALADLTDPAWSERVGGPFDLAVSAIAIHNL